MGTSERTLVLLVVIIIGVDSFVVLEVDVVICLGHFSVSIISGHDCLV